MALSALSFGTQAVLGHELNGINSPKKPSKEKTSSTPYRLRATPRKVQEALYCHCSGADLIAAALKAPARDSFPRTRRLSQPFFYPPLPAAAASRSPTPAAAPRLAVTSALARRKRAPESASPAAAAACALQQHPGETCGLQPCPPDGGGGRGGCPRLAAPPPGVRVCV